MTTEERLEIVNENDEITGQDTRQNIHQEGLLHREIHIWFITLGGDMIFQHRAKDKDMYPDLLDATVGGHVDVGMSYEDTAIKELFEETGIRASINDLHVLKKMRGRSVDQITGKVNNVFRLQYGYVFRCQVTNLKVEKNKAIGFEAWPINKIFNLNNIDRKRFIPTIYSEEFLEMFKGLKKLI